MAAPPATRRKELRVNGEAVRRDSPIAGDAPPPTAAVGNTAKTARARSKKERVRANGDGNAHDFSKAQLEAITDAVDRLKDLPVRDYELCRRPEAKRLGIRMVALDAFVRAAAEEAAIARLRKLPEHEWQGKLELEASWLGYTGRTKKREFKRQVAQARYSRREQEARRKAAIIPEQKVNGGAEPAAREAGTEEGSSGDTAVPEIRGFTIVDELESDQLTKRPPRKPDTNGALYPDGFEMKGSGLWYQPQAHGEGETPAPVWVSAPFEVLAQTNDETDHGHGLLLRWTAPTGQEHQWAMPQRMVHAEGNAIASELHDAGLPCATSRLAHEQLKNFLGSVGSIHRVRCVERSGWHGSAYVLPNGSVFSADAGRHLVLQSEHAPTAGLYDTRGTLEQWQEHISRNAVGNELLMFTMSAAFAGPLLDVMGETSGGIHIFGGSQTGKTTLMCTTASVWGPGDIKTGPIRSWRATANALEAVAAEHNDGILILDEIGQVSGREVGEVVYMFANQRGKARMNRAGGARRLSSWRLLYFSTGETTLATKMGEAGQRPYAGQDVRLLGLSADAGAGFGVFQKLHGAASAGAFADQLRRDAVSYCGTAGPAFLENLVRDRAKDPGRLESSLRKGREKFLARNLSDGVDGQVRSAAARFALIGLAGELALAYGVVPWTDGDAMRAAERWFNSWLTARGGAGAAEDKQALSMVAEFIALHGSARFGRLSQDPEQEPEDRRIENRAGYVRATDDGQEFLILAAVWHKEVCRGLDPGRSARALLKAGLLEPESDRRLTQRPEIPGRGRTRVYVIRGAILGERTHEVGDDGAPLDGTSGTGG
jgi:uncharacterized protein (DUF927 family)